MPVDFIFGKPIMDAFDTLHHTFDSITKCEEKQFAEGGIPLQQYLVLRAITSAMKYHGGPVTLSVLGDWLDRHPNSMTSMIDRMEKAGLVRRIRDLKDRRAYRLDLTPKGWKKLNQGKECIANLPEKIYSVLSDEELVQFTFLLRKVRDNTYAIRNVKNKVIDISAPKEK